METLSSSLTFFYKFIVTMLWIGGFGSITVLAVATGKLDARGLEFGAVWIVGSLLLWWTCGRLKRVRLNGAMLVISNYREEISVPVADIEQAKQDLLGSPRSATLTFRKSTRFGTSIRFLPPISSSLLVEHEVVKRLRRLARSNYANSV